MVVGQPHFPKNSKWLQENLTDMDAKVKAMIKLIEEDADSFARRAEMYYKKRPELMKLVEEFYRAYRALAERYDHATGVIRQAHWTMTKAFPNQVPLVPDDSPASSASETDPRTPQMSPPVRALFEPDDLQKDALELSSSQSQALKRNGAFTEESDFAIGRKGLKHLNDLFGSGECVKFSEGRVRKGLDFHEAVEDEKLVQNNGSTSLHAQPLPESKQMHNSEEEISTLRETLARLEAEKEAGLLQYQQCVERLNKLESEISNAQEDSRCLTERASKAEAEVQSLKESLTKLEAEKEESLLQYKQCLDRISALEDIISHAKVDAGELSDQASKAETETQCLKQDLSKIEAEKDDVLDKYKKSLDMISHLENKLLCAEEDAERFNKRANKAESEVEDLKQAIDKLNEEKESAALKYQQCMDTISSLERKISYSQEEVQRLNGEIDDGVTKLKGAEERCVMLERSNHSLHSELEAMVLKMGTQSQELTEKQKELGRLWTCIQEERLRFVEAETAFQTLQHVHSQAQEELRSLASELKNRAHILRDMEAQNHILQDEIMKVQEENKSLNDFNMSTAMSMKDMQNEILGLRETKGKLEVEVGLRVDQRNALQQEIYCIKEELNVLNKKHQALLEQVDAVGLNPDCLKSSVKELQVENSSLKETWQRVKSEEVALLEKLEILEQLLEKNALLENSLADLNAELEGVRRNIKALEESYQSLLEEKSTLVDESENLKAHLKVTKENLVELSEKNIVLENSLSDAHVELEGLKEKSKSLENSCQLLVDQKVGLIVDKDSLFSQLVMTEQKLEGLENSYKVLEEKCLILEKEKESALHRVKEIQASMDIKKQEHASFAQLSATQMSSMETQIGLLLEKAQQGRRELEEQLDKALDSQIEIFVLQRCVKDLEGKSFSLQFECQKLLGASKLLETTLLELEQEKLEQQAEVKSLSDQTNTLRMGMHQLLKAFDIVLENGCEDGLGQDRKCLNQILRKLQDSQYSLCQTLDENQKLAIEMSVLVSLLRQLKLETEILETEKHAIDDKLSTRTEQFLVLQSEVEKFNNVNEELRLKVREGDHKEAVLTAQVESLLKELLEIQVAFQNLHSENSQVLEEKGNLMEEFLHLKENGRSLEEDNLVLFGEMLSLSNISLILKDYINVKAVALKELGEDLGKLHAVNHNLEEKLSMTERTLVEVQMENLHLKDTLEKSVDELKTIAIVRDQLNYDIANEKNLLCQKAMELLEAEQKLSVMEYEKSELHKIVEDLQRLYSEVKITKDTQEMQILELSEDIDCLRKENVCLDEGNQQLKVELLHLQEEHGKTKNREEILLLDLQRGKSEIDMWDMQAAEFFGELQTSIISQALFEEKVHQLIRACESLESESNSKDLNIQHLKGTISTLEGENKGLKAQLALHGPIINSLRDCITSLENLTSLHGKPQKLNNDEGKNAELANHCDVESHLYRDQNTMVPDAFLDLQDLQGRVKDIEDAVLESERLALQENLSMHTKLEAAMRQIEELKSQCSSQREKVHPTSEISEAENGILTKDIMLDHISECSSYGISRRETVEADNQMLELWEAVDQDGSIDLTVGKAKKGVSAQTNKNIEYHQFDAVKTKKTGSPSSGLKKEKELGVDRLEISKISTEPRQEGSKRKALERLNSDVQKLTNLQITVQDLKRKVQITEKSSKGKDIVEFETLRGQLEEAEEAILKLFDLNGKLIKSIEDSSIASNGNLEAEESGSVRRRRISEQARKVSEKIGQLQLEVQKIQFVLLKLLDEKGKTRMSESKRRVLLQDYLYGGGRTNRRRKKGAFCGCVQPPTKGD